MSFDSRVQNTGAGLWNITFVISYIFGEILLLFTIDRSRKCTANIIFKNKALIVCLNRDDSRFFVEWLGTTEKDLLQYWLLTFDDTVGLQNRQKSSKNQWLLLISCRLIQENAEMTTSHFSQKSEDSVKWGMFLWKARMIHKQKMDKLEAKPASQRHQRMACQLAS